MKSVAAPRSSVEQVRTAGFFLGVICLMGVGLAWLTDLQGLGDAGHPSSSNVFYFLYVHYERWALLLTSLAFFALWIGFGRSRFLGLPIWSGRGPIWAVATAVVLVSAVGTFLVCLNHPLPMDEFFADFQARIFLQGRLFGTIPETMQPVEEAATPLMTEHRASQHLWISNYLPVYSLLRVPFVATGLSWLCNPLLAGVSILLTAGCARRIWPENKTAPWLAALLLATSTQFLITSMTAYSMPAHLCFNLLWLWCYLRRTWTGLLMATAIGFLAMGLHQVNVHLLFVSGFFLAELVARRWARFSFLSVSYLGFLWLWVRYMAVRSGSGEAIASGSEGMLQSLLQVLSWPGAGDLQLHAMNFALIWSWQSVALSVFAVVGVLRIRHLAPPLFALLVSAVATFGFYFLFPSDQGHGWGYRYFYVGLIPLIFLAVGGWEILCAEGFERSGRGLLQASTVLALFVQLPVRAWEVRDFSAPFAKVSDALHQIDADYVIVDTLAVWYGQDLVRNFAEPGVRPVLLFAYRLGPDEIAYLQENGKTVFVSGDRLNQSGLTQREPPRQ